MKPAPVLLGLSLAANAALFVTIGRHPRIVPPAFRDFFARPFGATEVAAAPVAAKPPTSAAKTPLWSTVPANDLNALVARLRALGFPPSIVRAIVGAEVAARYNSRLRELTSPDPNTPYWRTSPYATFDSARMAEYTRLQTERSRLLRDLFKDPFFTADDVSPAQRRRFGNLPSQKIDMLQRIEDDYSEMISAARGATNGIMLPEDREKLALLARERHADLAGVLTPEELADYELRSSPLTTMLARELGNFDANEAEFRAIFQAHQAYSDKFPGGGGVISFQDRGAAAQELQAQLKSALGDQRYADYQRETDRDYQQLSRLAERANLPAATAASAFDVRYAVAAQTQQIADDASLDADQKRAALQLLAQNTRTQLTALLGPTVGPMFVNTSNRWLNQVERGMAVSFNGPPSMTMTTAGPDGSMVTASFGTGVTYRPVARPTPPTPAPSPRQ
ncbi:MAG TPA: hypothetical protein VHD62_16350 [Opitutaceae bacterium]|nr:hypothetical protein [Opitutaceae bacterium]